MPLVDVATRTPIQRLLQFAAGRTGQAGTVAASLLAWWNAKSCRESHRTTCGQSEAIARDMLSMAAFIATLRD